VLLITIFVELGVVAGRSRTPAGSPQAVSRRPYCAVALRRTAWSEHGKCESDTAALPISNGKYTSKPLVARHGRRTSWARHAMCESAFIHPPSDTNFYIVCIKILCLLISTHSLSVPQRYPYWFTEQLFF